MAPFSPRKVTGFANQADEEAGEMLTLAELLTINMTAARLYRMKGNTLEADGISHGDMLLVECTSRWKYGDLVIAEIEGEQVVKFIEKSDKDRGRVIAVVKRCIKCYD